MQESRARGVRGAADENRRPRAWSPHAVHDHQQSGGHEPERQDGLPHRAGANRRAPGVVSAGGDDDEEEVRHGRDNVGEPGGDEVGAPVPCTVHVLVLVGTLAGVGTAAFWYERGRRRE